MPPPKLHVSASYAIPRVDLPSKPTWAETFVAAGTTVNGAPAWLEPAQVVDGIFGEPIITFTTIAGDWWISVGDPPPDPTIAASARFLVREGESLSVVATPHDRARVAPA